MYENEDFQHFDSPLDGSPHLDQWILLEILFIECYWFRDDDHNLHTVFSWLPQIRRPKGRKIGQLGPESSYQHELLVLYLESSNNSIIFGEFIYDAVHHWTKVSKKKRCTLVAEGYYSNVMIENRCRIRSSAGKKFF